VIPRPNVFLSPIFSFKRMSSSHLSITKFAVGGIFRIIRKGEVDIVLLEGEAVANKVFGLTLSPNWIESVCADLREFDGGMTDVEKLVTRFCWLELLTDGCASAPPRGSGWERASWTL
jgi:hypothetical protein